MQFNRNALDIVIQLTKSLYTMSRLYIMLYIMLYCGRVWAYFVQKLSPSAVPCAMRKVLFWKFCTLFMTSVAYTIQSQLTPVHDVINNINNSSAIEDDSWPASEYKIYVLSLSSVFYTIYNLVLYLHGQCSLGLPYLMFLWYSEVMICCIKRSQNNPVAYRVSWVCWSREISLRQWARVVLAVNLPIQSL